MKLKLRLLLLAIASFFQKRTSVFDENVLNLRVLPNDLDFLRISNDRYLSLMDLGRFGIAFRGGLFLTFVKNRWFPITRVATVRFRHPLWLFQKYQLRSRVIYLDTEWIWTEHRFERNNRTIAIGIIKVAMTGPRGIVPVAEVVAATGESAIPLPVPNIVADILNVEEQIRAMQE